ncbi:hypothetical protein [Streptacidiphilus monticola]|uniref:Uncharacterized protein n=1 Tax=Streptacidiphilus monticola TaxID=2161674 RepID=A0ABW1GAN5_9ACTN
MHHSHRRRTARSLHRALGLPPRTRAMSCGKTWFPDRIAAELALVSIKQRNQARGCATTRAKEPVRCYACPHCAGWHLTSIQS